MPTVSTGFYCITVWTHCQSLDSCSRASSPEPDHSGMAAFYHSYSYMNLTGYPCVSCWAPCRFYLWFFPVWSCGLVPVGSSLWSSLCGPLLWSSSCASPVGSTGSPVACSGIDAAQGRSIPLQVAGCRFIIIRTGSPVPAQRKRKQIGRPCPARPALQPLQASNGLSGYPRTTSPEKRAQRPACGLPEASIRHAAGHTRPCGPPALTRTVRARARAGPHGGARVGRRWSPPLAFATQF